MSPAISETKDVEVIKPSATAATVHPPLPRPTLCTLKGFRMEKNRILVLDS